ncbi:MAG TPA: ArsR family transcriptional regulator [Candidatus Corynebacterium avicola]|uniref:ArsR family transcriptional regulator n=1 Tax=Candidatus Corynebacterium avicola TaxID=2838527 RepID=A0A9D1RPG5_9CORY|nr:ArsR family transcriptional regulator [Candidatus Corynebacterium avicola]
MPGPIALPHPSRDELSITDVMSALGDPGRLSVVRQLTDGPQDVAGCSFGPGEMPKSTRSHQLKVLREAGLIRNEPADRGPRRMVSLRREDLDARFPGLLDVVLASASDKLIEDEAK